VLTNRAVKLPYIDLAWIFHKPSLSMF
jgi:hypothetical protein